MNRRRFILAISGALGLSAAGWPGRADCAGGSATGFVETLYRKQARLQAEQTPTAEEEFYALFSRGMRTLMRAPRRFPKDMQFGRILNAFFGWGVLPATEVKLGTVTLEAGDDSGPATVRVEIEHHSEPHKIWVRVVNENGDWRIANISYDSGISLIEHYRSFTAPG